MVIMLIPDLLNILFDQSDYSMLVGLASLNKRKTNYAMKYSLLGLTYFAYVTVDNFADMTFTDLFNHAKLKAVKHILDCSGCTLRRLPSCGHVVDLVGQYEYDCVLQNVLRCAAESDDLLVVKYAVGKGADVHADGEYCLINSVEYGRLDMVKYLVSVGANVHARHNSAFRKSVMYGHLDIAKYLVSVGADVNDFGGLTWSFMVGDCDMKNYLVSIGFDIHADDDFALRTSAANGRLQMVEYLIGVGANVHANNDEALRLSANGGHLDVVKFLISVGANVAVGYDARHETPLSFEVWKNIEI